MAYFFSTNCTEAWVFSQLKCIVQLPSFSSDKIVKFSTEEGVAAGGHIFAADGDVSIGDEGGGLICAGAPHLPVRHESAVDFARLMRLRIVDAGAGVIHVNSLAIGELALRVGRGAGTLALVLLGRGGDCEGEDQ